jgi:hypothetical protein
MPIIQILCFRGTSGFDNPKYEHLPGLIKAGHVGIKFEGDSTIYGFHPSPKAEEDAGGEGALLDMLKEHQAQEGTWQDDTDIFIQAHNLSKQGEKTEVWVLSHELSDDEFSEIYGRSLSWYSEGKVSRYNLPNLDGTFADGEYNCATFPKILGVELPVNNGLIRIYIAEIKKLGAKLWTAI